MKDEIMRLADAYAAEAALDDRNRNNREGVERIRSALEASVGRLTQPTVSQDMYEAAVKGRQEFRLAYRDAKARIAALEAAVDALVQPMTDEEINQIYVQVFQETYPHVATWEVPQDSRDFARAIEAKLREKAS